MKKLRKVLPQFQEQIDSMVASLLLHTPYNIFRKAVHGFIADVTRGKAYYADSMFTVPYWAFNPDHPKNLRSNGRYFVYYVAHELAHLIGYKKYGIRCNHDARFYQIFTEICPEDCQHFELDYKKTASKYGIGKK